MSYKKDQEEWFVGMVIGVAVGLGTIVGLLIWGTVSLWNIMF